MKGSFKIAEIQGISINIHITFLLLILIFGKWFFFILAVFFFVTMHELAHSLVAKKLGIGVKEITLLPIGGVASMVKMPEKPYQEFLISLAGPLFNIAVVIIFYFPVKFFVGAETFTASFKSFFGGYLPLYDIRFMVAQVYWVNLILAAFNLLPAFPMDGGRILRSLLVKRFGFEQATKIAVNFGHIFALLFGYIGLVNGRIILLIIAVFIYMAASSEEVQVGVKLTLKKFRVKDILSRDFLTVKADAVLSKVLELVFHSRQEDFPVMNEDASAMIGFVTRYDIINGIHKYGVSGKVQDTMRKDVSIIEDGTTLDKVQSMMHEMELKALPVTHNGQVIGVITMDDISRVYSMMALKK